MRLNTIGSDYSGSNPFLLLFSRLKNKSSQNQDSQGELKACLIDIPSSYQQDEFTPRSEKYMLLMEKGLIEEDEGHEKFDDDEDDDDDD